MKILILPDHPTPVSIRTHTSDPVPFLMYGSRIKPDAIMKFRESVAESSTLLFKDGHTLMNYFITGENHHVP